MWQFDPLVVNPELTVEPPAGETHAIVVGCGRIGKVVCSLLKEHDISYIAVDHDASGVARDRREGQIVYYCDASDLRFLEKCGLRKTTGVIITVHSQSVIAKVVDGSHGKERKRLKPTGASRPWAHRAPRCCITLYPTIVSAMGRGNGLQPTKR